MKREHPGRITVIADGPYLVEGGVELAHQHVVTNDEGESLEWREGATVPGSHVSIGFRDRT
jgi:hypothetical protein